MNSNLPNKTGLSLDRLKSFCLVAECGSITKAAQDDTNRQSQFSRQIKDLETYFGAELFKRKGRTISLTENGERLLRITKEFYASLEDFTECCGMDQRDIRIGAGDSIIQWLLLPKLPELKESTEQANLMMCNLRTDEIVSKLLHGDLHYGIIRKEAIHPELKSIPIGTLSFSLFTPKGTQRKSKDAAKLLDGLSLAGMEGEGRYNECMSILGRELGIILKFAVRCSSFPMMCKAVRSLNLAAVMPSIAKSELEKGQFETTELESLKVLKQDLSLCWNGRLEQLNDQLGKDAVSIAKQIGL
jgi:DNA-binding transcriptional LysR family regulator